jgi:hypothetical protein
MCLCSSLQAVCGVSGLETILTSELPPYDNTLSYFCGRPSANKCRPLLQVYCSRQQTPNGASLLAPQCK